MRAVRGTRERFGLWGGIKQIYSAMSASRRRQLCLVLGLMLVGAVTELATIGAVIPFIALLASSGRPTLPAAHFFLTIFVWAHHPLIVATVVFVLFAIVSGLLRLQLAWSTRSFIFRLGHELSVDIQQRVLSQPYAFHTEGNTSTLLAALNKTEVLCFDVLLPLMYAAASGVIALFIVAILLFVDAGTTLAVTAAFLGMYLLIGALTRNRLASSSKALAKTYDQRLQVVQESLGGIRDVIIDNSQAMYLRTFETLDSDLNAARTTNQFISIAPRYLIEMGAMILIAVVAYMSAQRHGGIALALPILGAVALGAQRLLPLVQQVYAGWSAVAGQWSLFEQVVQLLRLPIAKVAKPAAAPLQVKRGISLEHVGFSYKGRTRKTLEDVSLSIPFGSMLALVGDSGSGKSTLLDLLMGLLEPDEGEVLIDDIPLTADRRQQWHRSIAHVPQTIFLADSTISRNIALSLPDSPLDPHEVVEAAKKAQLHDFVMSLPAGYETYVGERGLRLSGGQRQRLGIARAIYKRAPVLVLDEATNALDESTEAAVLDTLARLRYEGHTIIIVAHRLSTISRCDLVARMEDGRLAQSGSFEDFMRARTVAS